MSEVCAAGVAVCGALPSNKSPLASLGMNQAPEHLSGAPSTCQGASPST